MPEIPQQYLIVGGAALLILILIIVLIVRNRRSRVQDAYYDVPESAPQTPEDSVQVQPAQIATPPQPAKNPYTDARTKAFNATPINAGSDKVSAVMMDWDLGSGNTLTLVAAANGEAALHFSNGSTINGGSLHENVSRAAKSFVAKASDYLPKTIITNNPRLPEKGAITFYLLTGERRYGAQEKLDHFYDGTSPWLPLFDEGEKVIAELQALGEAEAQ